MVRISEKIIRNIRSYGISSQNLGTAILVLDCLDKGKYHILDVMDDENKERQMISLYRDLQRKELIDNSVNSDYHFIITEKGKSLIDYIQAEIDEIPTEGTAIEERLGQVAEPPIEDWINEYIELFPEKSHGKKLRDSKVRVTARMKDLLESYPHSKDTVLQATKDYLAEGINEYTRNCFYFIYKNVKGQGWVSDLLTYCENVERRAGKPKLTNFDTI